MRYDRESWRKLYREEPLDQRSWPVMARGLRDYLIRQPSDDDGTLLKRTTDPVSDLVRVLGACESETEACADAVRLLLKDGYLKHDAKTGRLWIKRFREAQTARSKEAERKAKQRAKGKRTPRGTVTGQSRDASDEQPGTVPPPETGRGRSIEETRSEETRRDDSPAPDTAQGERAGQQDPTSPGPCPPFLTLTDDQRAQLQIGRGIPDATIDLFTTTLVAKWLADADDPTKWRTPAQWRKTLSTAILGDWNAGKRPPPPDPTPAERASRAAKRRAEDEAHMREQQAKAAAEAPPGAPRPDLGGVFG